MVADIIDEFGMKDRGGVGVGGGTPMPVNLDLIPFSRGFSLKTRA